MHAPLEQQRVSLIDLAALVAAVGAGQLGLAQAIADSAGLAGCRRRAGGGGSTCPVLQVRADVATFFGQGAILRAATEVMATRQARSMRWSSVSTSRVNPCAGFKGRKETGRDVYVEDNVFQLVHDAAEQPLKDAIDLAYLIGQRPVDVLKLTRADMRDGALWLLQNKTKHKVRVAVEGELAALLEQLGNRR